MFGQVQITLKTSNQLYLGQKIYKIGKQRATVYPHLHTVKACTRPMLKLEQLKQGQKFTQQGSKQEVGILLTYSISYKILNLADFFNFDPASGPGLGSGGAKTQGTSLYISQVPTRTIMGPTEAQKYRNIAFIGQ